MSTRPVPPTLANRVELGPLAVLYSLVGDGDTPGYVAPMR